MARKYSKSVTRRENRDKPFAYRVYGEIEHSMSMARRQRWWSPALEPLARDFFIAVVFGENYCAHKTINLAMIENTLVRRGRNELKLLGRMYVKAIVTQAEHLNGVHARAERLGHSTPPLRTTLPGESRPWFQPTARKILREKLDRDTTRARQPA